MAPATSPATPAIKTSFLCRSRRGNADDQARGRDDAIVGPEHCGSQPPNAADEVALRMQAKTAHVFLLITPWSVLRPSRRSRSFCSGEHSDAKSRGADHPHQFRRALAPSTDTGRQPSGESFSPSGEGMAAFDIPRVRSNPTHEKQNDEDDQNDADDTDAAMTVAVAVAAEATTEATKQEDDEEDDEYESDRHDLSPVAAPKP